jgi:soluble lytic murein transglycosylase-like protein
MRRVKKQWIRKLATNRASLHAKRLMMLGVGAALCFGGATDAFDGVRFVVEKDLDTVRVVRMKGQDESVVANLEGKYTSNSVFKLSRILPDRYVTQESNLFDPQWFPVQKIAEATVEIAEIKPMKAVESLAKDFSLINEGIQQEFFKTLPFGELIFQKSQKYDVDPSLVAAVIEQESRFKPRAISPVGARGLMQLMPRTGRWMGARNLYDPEQNVDAGVKYLKYLDKTFNGDTKKVIAAYNAGEGNVRRYRGTPPFRETRTYVKNVTRNYQKRQKQLAAYNADRDSSR